MGNNNFVQYTERFGIELFEGRLVDHKFPWHFHPQYNLVLVEEGVMSYYFEPTGSFENDPNVTDKKFPGNPTRSYRSLSPLKIVGEVTDWVKITPEELQKWREKLAKNEGEIIN